MGGELSRTDVRGLVKLSAGEKDRGDKRPEVDDDADPARDDLHPHGGHARGQSDNTCRVNCRPTYTPLYVRCKYGMGEAGCVYC